MQDRAIAAIGRLSRSRMEHSEPYQFYIEDMFPNREYKMLLAVFEVTEAAGVWLAQFKETDIDIVSSRNYQRYLYRKGSPNGGDITVTTKAGDIGKKLTNVFRRQLRAAHQLARGREAALMGALTATVEERFEEIKSKVVALLDTLDKKDRQQAGFSIKLIDEGEERYLNDYEVFRGQILSHGVEGKKEKYSIVSAAEDQVCSICQEQKPEVMGFASPFKYATVDKPGMVAGFFDQRNNWKNYPICSGCALDFELGQKFVVAHLQKYFFGLSYYLIPKPVLSKDEQSLDMAITLLKDIDYQLSVKEQSQISSREHYLMRRLGASENAFSMNLLFFEENATTKAISITLLLEEILPSRFKRLFIDVPDVIESHPLYRGVFTDKKSKEKRDLIFSFGLIKEFFEDQFSEMIHKVFMGVPLSPELLWGHFMQVIRRNHADGNSSYLTIIKAHLLIRYFAHLGMLPVSITDQQSIPMDTTTQDTPAKKEGYKRSFDKEQLTAFIRENADFFDKPYKQGVFAVGILVRLLLNIQYQTMNGNTPFQKKLKGFNLNHEALMGVYVEAISKLSQFKYKDRNFFIQIYTDLRDFISDHFTLRSHELAKISNNELSFYFVAGLEMGNKFKLEVEAEEEDVTNN